jgi:hypothetical protein
MDCARSDGADHTVHGLLKSTGYLGMSLHIRVDDFPGTRFAPLPVLRTFQKVFGRYPCANPLGDFIGAIADDIRLRQM